MIVFISEYKGRNQEDYVQLDERTSSQGALYSVSQRVAPVSSVNYSNLGKENNLNSENSPYINLSSTDWESNRNISTTDTNKENSDVEKQNNGECNLSSE